MNSHKNYKERTTTSLNYYKIFDEKKDYNFIIITLVLLISLIILFIEKEGKIYGKIVIISMLVSTIFIYNELKKHYKNTEIFTLLISVTIGAPIIAILISFILKIISKGEVDIGFNSFAALLGILLISYIYSKIMKIDSRRIIYSYINVVPLIYSIGKIGCFIVGCCYGIKYSGPFAIVYHNSLEAPNNTKLFPIQIVESIVFLLLFILINYKKSDNSKKSYLTLINCGVWKFTLDFFRYYNKSALITFNQILSIISIIAGICIKKINYKNTPNT